MIPWWVSIIALVAGAIFGFLLAALVMAGGGE